MPLPRAACEAHVLALPAFKIQPGMLKEEVKTDDGCDCLSRLRPGGEIHYYSDVLFQLHGSALRLFPGCLIHGKILSSEGAENTILSPQIQITWEEPFSRTQ